MGPTGGSGGGDGVGSGDGDGGGRDGTGGGDGAEVSRGSGRPTCHSKTGHQARRSAIEALAFIQGPSRREHRAGQCGGGGGRGGESGSGEGSGKECGGSGSDIGGGGSGDPTSGSNGDDSDGEGAGSSGGDGESGEGGSVGAAAVEFEAASGRVGRGEMGGGIAGAEFGDGGVAKATGVVKAAAMAATNAEAGGGERSASTAGALRATSEVRRVRGCRRLRRGGASWGGVGRLGRGERDRVRGEGRALAPSGVGEGGVGGDWARDGVRGGRHKGEAGGGTEADRWRCEPGEGGDATSEVTTWRVLARLRRGGVWSGRGERDRARGKGRGLTPSGAEAGGVGGERGCGGGGGSWHEDSARLGGRRTRRGGVSGGGGARSGLGRRESGVSGD